MGFFGSKSESEKPIVTEIQLRKEYKFMYENFVISSQHKLYLLLEENNDILNVLSFRFLIYKYGYPNDEVGHPLQSYGLGFYGFFEVKNSKWIDELKSNNRSHSKHIDSLYDNYKHYVAKFKDVTLEVIAEKYEEMEMTKNEINEILKVEFSYINNGL